MPSRRPRLDENPDGNESVIDTWRFGSAPFTLVAMQRRLSAGIVVARETVGGVRYLLLRAYRNWDFPKGLVEPGEDPLAAALREVHEETGVADVAFKWGTEFIETEPYARNKIARYYVGLTRTERVTLQVNSALGRPEHHEYRWAELAEALTLVGPRLQRVMAWAASRIIRPAQLA